MRIYSDCLPQIQVIKYFITNKRAELTYKIIFERIGGKEILLTFGIDLNIERLIDFDKLVMFFQECLVSNIQEYLVCILITTVKARLSHQCWCCNFAIKVAVSHASFPDAWILHDQGLSNSFNWILRIDIISHKFILCMDRVGLYN